MKHGVLNVRKPYHMIMKHGTRIGDLDVKSEYL